MGEEREDIERLRRLLVMFMAGAEADISLEAANRIESCICGLSIAEEDVLMEFADSLAQYRPEGGDYLYSYGDMRPLAQEALDEVRMRLG